MTDSVLDEAESRIEDSADAAMEALRRRYFWVHLGADFIAGISFVVGSIFFFWESLLYAGTWMFLIGSIMFAAKPTIRLVHEIHRARKFGAKWVRQHDSIGGPA